MTDTTVRPLAGIAPEQLRAFFRRVPEGDRTFFREDVLADGVVDGWLADGTSRRQVAVSDGEVVGYLAVIPGVGWSSHVGEIRVVVDPERRRQGIGRALARQGLMEGLDLGLTKLVVEVVAEQEATLAMFAALGFEAEALLKGHVRDGSGAPHDLITMAHFVDANWDLMHTVGIDDAIAD